MPNSSVWIEKLKSKEGTKKFFADSNKIKLISFPGDKYMLDFLQNNIEQNIRSSHDLLTQSNNDMINGKQMVSKISKHLYNPGLRTKLGLKLQIYCDPDTDFDFQTKLIIMLGQAINSSNLKINSLDISITNDNHNLNLHNEILRFHRRLRRHGKLLEYLKLNLGSMYIYNESLSNYNNKILEVVGSIFDKLNNLKMINLNIWLNTKFPIEATKDLNNLYKNIGLYLRNLRSIKLTLNNDFLIENTRFKIPIKWNIIQQLTCLENFTLLLNGEKIICSKSSIINLLKIMEDHPKLKKYHIYINNKSSYINIIPFLNLGTYFKRSNILESLRIDIPIEEKNQDINEEFIKVLKKCGNLKELTLVCGSASNGFRYKLAEIFENLGILQELQRFTIDCRFKNQVEVFQLAMAISRMKKLEKLDIDLLYSGKDYYNFNNFISSVNFSQNTLKYLRLYICGKNSGTLCAFWESLAKILPSQTLEYLDILVSVRTIYINNHCMKIFADKLIQNIKLSELRLGFIARYKYNGEGLLWIPKLIKKLRFINRIELDYAGLNSLNTNYFDVLSDSLKDKYIKEISIAINYENNIFIFPSNTIDHIVKVFNNTNRTIKRAYLAIPIYNLKQNGRNKLLNMANYSQIPNFELDIQEYNKKNDIFYERYLIYSTYCRPKLSYHFFTEEGQINDDDDDFF